MDHSASVVSGSCASRISSNYCAPGLARVASQRSFLRMCEPLRTVVHRGRAESYPNQGPEGMALSIFPSTGITGNLRFNNYRIRWWARQRFMSPSYRQTGGNSLSLSRDAASNSGPEVLCRRRETDSSETSIQMNDDISPIRR